MYKGLEKRHILSAVSEFEGWESDNLLMPEPIMVKIYVVGLVSTELWMESTPNCRILPARPCRSESGPRVRGNTFKCKDYATIKCKESAIRFIFLSTKMR